MAIYIFSSPIEKPHIEVFKKSVQTSSLRISWCKFVILSRRFNKFVGHFESYFEQIIILGKYACDVTTWVVVFKFNMASKEIMPSAEKTDSICSEDQVIQPYMFEPNKGDKDETFYDSNEDSTSEEEEFDDEFEAANAWRRSTLDWCKCGKCSIMEKTIESFCCHEKALEYDEYDDLLTGAQNTGLECITSLEAFENNMLSRDVLHIDVSQYLEENWPIGDNELEQTHKLYRYASYRRCSRWVFTILGKKHRRVFPSCVYTCIRKEFASPNGLYTHFKFAK